MFMETVLSRSMRLMFAGSIAVGIGAVATPVVAQEAALQRVEVTGSNIRRAQSETASPIQTITREELDKSGKSTVSEYLQTLTSDGAGSLPTGFGNGFAAGSTAVSLRGLGATSTLVLLNGRRMASFGRADDGQKTFTDLSTVPMDLVQRIEILKDGASSIYGADAIAGVVNIILRKDFVGTIIKGNLGSSNYNDAAQRKGSISHGFGNLDTDRYNVIMSAELSKADGLQNKDRADRDWIGHADIRPWGYALANQFSSGQTTSAGSASPTGTLLNPVTGKYTSLPGCATLSQATPQNDAGGNCVWYADQFRSMQPDIKSANLYARATFQINSDWQGYAEAGYSKRDTSFMMTPPSITPTVAFPPTAAIPTGVINYSSGVGTALLMAASHPQNPYGVAVRVRYSAFDIGAQTRVANNEFDRFVIGAKGSAFGWDIDTAYLHSSSKLHLDYSAALNMAVLKAALSDPTSPYFPYYIGDQAYKNKPELYKAMVRNITSDSTTKLDLVDFKASRELWALPGGNLGLAVGAEYRKESLDNPSLSGTENGSVNSSYVAAKGDQAISAVYAEVSAPVLKSLELTAAVRYDHYTGFSSTTPKLGAKWTPVKEFALRSTYSEGFRAPGPAESSASSQSTGSSTVRDPVRCPGGTALPGAQATDCSIIIGAVKVGDPSLKPETSKGYTLGMVWDPLADTTLSVDAWQIKRSNEINPLPYVEAAALPTAIRSDNNLTINGVVVPNTGTLIISKAPYRNSSYTKIKGVDLEISQRFKLGDMGKLKADLKWTHIQSWLRAESATVQYEYAGTHGNCDTSNCAGTPKDKASLILSWDRGDWNVTTTTSFRAKMEDRYFKGDLCAFSYADGSPAPLGCELASFTTTDLSVRVQYSKQLQLFASVANLFDKIAPLDPLTYGGLSYNPMDSSGAIGRYFKIGAKYQF